MKIEFLKFLILRIALLCYEDKSVLDEGVTVVNSVLGGMISVGSGTAITNSSIYGNFCIGSNSLISGISLDCFVVYHAFLCVPISIIMISLQQSLRC